MFFVSLAPSFEHTPLALGGSQSSVVGNSRSGQYSAELQAKRMLAISLEVGRMKKSCKPRRMVHICLLNKLHVSLSH
ncbi:hypothetical protein GBAR_LOCUS12807 [Geodia barretti]|uniref:Uncharacterized protein n=1 Tax=Geodia barretti TaxID=519541 RepID=A0AA35WHI9_GEOBA|nr:hypothetical protein GBAR_LOCUS12807 [Geodia barretti]